MTKDEFWRWFSTRESVLWSAGEDSERLLDEIGTALTSYKPGLSVEVSDEEKGRRELTISAGGDPKLFTAVERLVAAAPPLKRWQVIALKPPRGFDFVFESGGVSLSPSQLLFDPLTSDKDPSALGIRVFVPGGSAQPGILEALWQLIEMGLGERLAASAIARLEVQEIPPNPEKYLPLVDLPKYVDWFQKRTGRRS